MTQLSLLAKSSVPLNLIPATSMLGTALNRLNTQLNLHRLVAEARLVEHTHRDFVWVAVKAYLHRDRPS